MKQMYKVFFNGRVIYLLEKMPDLEGKEKDFICTFMNREDLAPQLNTFLKREKSGNLYIYRDHPEKTFEIFSSCFTVINAAGGLVVNDRDEYLVIFRRGKWDLPKGKAEKQESSEMTALREVTEECHLEELTLVKFLTATYHIYFLGDKTVLKKTDWYLMRYSGTREPSPAVEEDIEKTYWLHRGNIDEITGNIFPSILEVIKAAG
jgi:8-oxo-dGTP pyrophosphatase MutT (NUDIX family)